MSRTAYYPGRSVRSRKGLVAMSSQTCEHCGAELDLTTSLEGMSQEECPLGCFTLRPTILRRPVCPECSSEGWTEAEGCVYCGYKWTVKACPWDLVPDWSIQRTTQGDIVLPDGTLKNSVDKRVRRRAAKNAFGGGLDLSPSTD